MRFHGTWLLLIDQSASEPIQCSGGILYHNVTRCTKSGEGLGSRLFNTGFANAFGYARYLGLAFRCPRNPFLVHSDMDVSHLFGCHDEPTWADVAAQGYVITQVRKPGSHGKKNQALADAGGECCAWTAVARPALMRSWWR